MLIIWVTDKAKALGMEMRAVSPTSLKFILVVHFGVLPAKINRSPVQQSASERQLLPQTPPL